MAMGSEAPAWSAACTQIFPAHTTVPVAGLVWDIWIGNKNKSLYFPTVPDTLQEASELSFLPVSS